MIKMNQVKKIQKLNDLLRTTFMTGKIVCTSGFHALQAEVKETLITKIREFNDFNPDNDPNQEHDFGSVEYEDTTVFWKIDYYDLNLKYHSVNPADHLATRRVLTVMLAEEY